MRILGFSKKWDKLKQDDFTTFRFARRDRDWQAGELVQIVYKPRSKGREVLGMAKITKKSARLMLPLHSLLNVYEEEAILDGFDNPAEMTMWLIKTYGEKRLTTEPMNKLTLKWQMPQG